MIDHKNKDPYFTLGERSMELMEYTVGQEGLNIVKRYVDGSYEILETLEPVREEDIILD